MQRMGLDTNGSPLINTQDLKENSPIARKNHSFGHFSTESEWGMSGENRILWSVRTQSNFATCLITWMEKRAGGTQSNPLPSRRVDQSSQQPNAKQEEFTSVTASTYCVPCTAEFRGCD